MGCNFCKDKIKNKIRAVGKFIYTSTNEKIEWFVDGVSGIKKCLTGEQAYTDEQIKENRKICASCEHATSINNNKLTIYSTCNLCDCLLICKTQVDNCPIGKFKITDLTVKGV